MPELVNALIQQQRHLTTRRAIKMSLLTLALDIPMPTYSPLLNSIYKQMAMATLIAWKDRKFYRKFLMNQNCKETSKGAIRLKTAVLTMKTVKKITIIQWLAKFRTTKRNCFACTIQSNATMELLDFSAKIMDVTITATVLLGIAICIASVRQLRADQDTFQTWTPNSTMRSKDSTITAQPKGRARLSALQAQPLKSPILTVVVKIRPPQHLLQRNRP